MNLQRVMAIWLMVSLMLSSFVLAEGNNEEVCLVSEKSDYKELRQDFYDVEDEYFRYRSEYKASMTEHDAEKQDLYRFRLQRLERDLEDLRDDIRDLKSDVEDVSNCSSKGDLLDDLQDLREEVTDLRDDVDDLLAESKSATYPAVNVNEYGWKQPAPTPTAAATQSEVVVSTLNSGPSEPTSAVTATVTVDKTVSPGEDGLRTAWLVAGVI
ncbi:hypothetical protein HY496_00355, partial [Candidatus Woesearchaeota archaeon]|nr:hypothetical protein [Candidatus Woesearchaeota archaeon]